MTAPAPAPADTTRSGETCTFHAASDAERQPTGPACGAPAKWVIVWPQTRQWSPACAAHHDALDAAAPPRTVIPMREWLAGPR